MSDRDSEPINLDSFETRDETSTRDDLLATLDRQKKEIRDLTAIVRRLQNDNLELASIREYLKNLRGLHGSCGLLVERVITDAGASAELRKYAEDVKKQVTVLAQR